jgi:hypothetical protein
VREGKATTPVGVPRRAAEVPLDASPMPVAGVVAGVVPGAAPAAAPADRGGRP